MDASIRKKSELDYPNFGDIEDGLISYTCYCYFGCCFCNLTICVVYPNGLRSRTMALGQAWTLLGSRKKLEARKILENAAESLASSKRFVGQLWLWQ